MEADLLYSFFKLLVALPIVIALAYLSLRIGKNYMQGVGKNKNVKIVETVAITNKAHVSIVKIGQEYMALGVTEGRVSVLKKLDEEEVAALKQKEETADVQKQFITVKNWVGTIKDDKFDGFKQKIKPGGKNKKDL